MRRLILPTTLGLAHGVGDGAAGLLLGALPRMMPLEQVSVLVLLYNLLAFGAQPIAGWATDKLRRPRAVAVMGLALLGLALVVMRLQPVLAVILAGIGSATFHVGGGALALCATQGRAAGPGLFAAPGVLGLAIGGVLAITHHLLVWPFLILLALLAALILALPAPALPYTTQESEPLFESHDLIMLVLLAAIALRSLVWTTLQYLLQMRWEMVLMMAVAAMVGKALGGFLADYVGWRRWTLGALLGAALLLNFGARQPWALLLGVALLQSATPAALAATVRLMPRQPATAAGLALGLAIALGGLPMLGGWSPTIGSPLVLAVMVASAAGLLILALTLQRREKANASFKVG